jgi:hypothetical protein
VITPASDTPIIASTIIAVLHTSNGKPEFTWCPDRCSKQRLLGYLCDLVHLYREELEEETKE